MLRSHFFRLDEKPRTLAVLKAAGWLVFILSGLAGLSSCQRPRQAEEAPPPNLYQAITGGDAEELREGWNAKYQTGAHVSGKEPDAFPKQSIHLFPKGKMLLFPLEDGRNGVFFAKNGFQVTGIDYSDSALRAANQLAQKNGVKIGTLNADLETYEFGTDRYDVIVGLDFYRERLIPQIKGALKTNGVLLYTVGVATPLQLKNNSIPPHTLKPGELRSLFSDFQIISYQELPPENAGPDQQPQARLIARKSEHR